MGPPDTSNVHLSATKINCMGASEIDILDGTSQIEVPINKMTKGDTKKGIVPYPKDYIVVLHDFFQMFSFFHPSICVYAVFLLVYFR